MDISIQVPGMYLFNIKNLELKMILLTNVGISKKSIVCALLAGQAICYYYDLAPAEDLLVRFALPGTIVAFKTVKGLIDKAKGKAAEPNRAQATLCMSDMEVAATTAIGALAASQLSDDPSEALLITMAVPGTWLAMKGLYGVSRMCREYMQPSLLTIEDFDDMDSDNEDRTQRYGKFSKG